MSALARLAVNRTEADINETADFADEGIEQRMRNARSDFTDSVDDRSEQLHS
jgi:hypothetical protein